MKNRNRRGAPDTFPGRLALLVLGPTMLVLAACGPPDEHNTTHGKPEQTETERSFESADERQLIVSMHRTLEGHKEWVFEAVFSPDGEEVATAGRDNTVGIWNVESGECLHVLDEHRNALNTVDWSPDDTTIASAGWGHILLWNPGIAKPTMRLSRIGSIVLSLGFSSDGKHLATAGSETDVKVWDVNTGEVSQTLGEHTALVRHVEFHPNGRWLASCGQDGAALLWDVWYGAVIRRFEHGDTSVNCIDFSAEKGRVVTCSYDKLIRLWSTESGELLRTLSGHKDVVWQVAFSPDGCLIASGAADGTVRVWSTEDGRELFCAQAHGNEVRSVTFSPDGLLLVSSGMDNNVVLWSVSWDLP